MRRSGRHLPGMKMFGASTLRQDRRPRRGREPIRALADFFGQNFPWLGDGPVTGWELLPKTFRRACDLRARWVASHWGCDDFTVFRTAGTNSAGLQPCPCPPERRLVRLAEPLSDAGRPAAQREDRTK